MDQCRPEGHLFRRVKYSFETFIEYPQSRQNFWFMHKQGPVKCYVVSYHRNFNMNPSHQQSISVTGKLQAL